MSSDDKDLVKIEKKRQKAQVKEMKKRREATPDLVGVERISGQPRINSRRQLKSLPWYKDPNWIKVAIAIVSLIIALFSLGWMMGVFN